MPDLYKIYAFFSPYFEIAFGALIAHRYFLKQFLAQKNLERTSQITNQRDVFNKEIFDQMTKKIENAYQALSDVKKYCLLFKSPNSTDFSFFENFLRAFIEKYFELYENIHLVLLTCEKYDFIIDPQQEENRITLALQSELLKICSQIEKLGGELLKNKLAKSISKDSWDQFNLEVENLSKVCSKINLHLQKLADASKVLIKDIFNSLNAQLQ